MQCMAREEIERYISNVKILEAVDRRPKTYCIELKDGFSSEFYTSYDMNKVKNRSQKENKKWR